MLRFLTAGESHGPQLNVILEGLPANLPLPIEAINAQLARRQGGYGRSGRQEIERDEVEIVGGVHNGLTTGAPVALRICNRDWVHWQPALGSDLPDPQDPVRQAAITAKRITRVRPGHADLPGAVKYRQTDVRNVVERASARETAARVVAGAVARLLLEHLGVTVFSHVLNIGGVRSRNKGYKDLSLLRQRAESSPVRCASKAASAAMMARIDRARKEGHSVGGVLEVIGTGLPIGLGSCMHWDRRLDGRLAQAVMSIPAIKGVEIGAGFALADLPGREAPDEIFPAPGQIPPWRRETNRAGGLEGGMTNGEPLLIRAVMKPISTQRVPLRSIDLATGKAAPAHFERADICAVPAAAVVAEAMVALVLADVALEKYGGDSLAEFLEHARCSQVTAGTTLWEEEFPPRTPDAGALAVGEETSHTARDSSDRRTPGR